MIHLIFFLFTMKHHYYNIFSNITDVTTKSLFSIVNLWIDNHDVWFCDSTISVWPSLVSLDAVLIRLMIHDDKFLIVSDINITSYVCSSMTTVQDQHYTSTVPTVPTHMTWLMFHLTLTVGAVHGVTTPYVTFFALVCNAVQQINKSYLLSRFGLPTYCSMSNCEGVVRQTGAHMNNFAHAVLQIHMLFHLLQVVSCQSCQIYIFKLI